MVGDALFSRNSDEWATPEKIYAELDAEFHFDLDPCATAENSKCKRYFDKHTNGLLKNWGGCRVFCNPPYSQIGKWVAKCFYESRQDNTLIVMLIPSRTDTKYFHNYIMHRAEIRFIKGRLKFGDLKNPAPFPSMVVIFRGANLEGD